MISINGNTEANRSSYGTSRNGVLNCGVAGRNRILQKNYLQTATSHAPTIFKPHRQGGRLVVFPPSEDKFMTICPDKVQVRRYPLSLHGVS